MAVLQLFLDLGDLFTKGLAMWDARRERLRFPSIVAHRLMGSDGQPAELLFEGGVRFPRPLDFDLRDYPRSRSFPECALLARSVRGMEVSGARFAGWLAAMHGADRQLLGVRPTEENVDALVHKTLLLLRRAGYDGSEVEVVFAIDVGVKAEVVARYVAPSLRPARFLAWRAGEPEPSEVSLQLRSRAVSSIDCAVAALPNEVSIARVQRLMLIDVGYMRTKLAIVSDQGCEYMEQVSDLGVADCVRRVLRDGQDQGLVEDEAALIRALESTSGVVDIAGRRFDVRPILRSATRALEEELTRAARRAVVSHYGRRPEVCRALAVVGGGAAMVGEGLAARLREANLGLRSTWVTRDTSFLLVDGARRFCGQPADVQHQSAVR